MSIAERIENCVLFLDVNEPDWPARVDENTLDMGTVFNCLFGQLYGSYFDGLNLLSLSGEEAVDLALDELAFSPKRIADLTKAWKLRIAQLKQERGL